MPFPWVNEEKDHFEEEEADALINFVEHLDFDEFVVPSVGPNWNAQIGLIYIDLLQFPRSEICNFAKPWVSKPWYNRNSVQMKHSWTQRAKALKDRAGKLQKEQDALLCSIKIC